MMQRFHDAARFDPNVSPRSQRGTVLLFLTLVSLIAVGATVAFFTTIDANSSAEAASLRTTRCDYIAHAAMQSALTEIVSGDDTTLEGLGAMGIATPLEFVSPAGAVVGEYRTIVEQNGSQFFVSSVAASPSFADPQVLSAAEALISAEPEFMFRPQPGAMNIIGPIVDPSFPSLGDNNFTLDGGQYSAIATSNLDTYGKVRDVFQDAIDSGALLDSDLIGGVTGDDTTLPIAHLEQMNVTAQTMNDYRDQLRTAVLDAAATPDLSITSTVLGDQTWGTADVPQVTVIDSDAIGSDLVFGTDNQTITGHGTLIIKGLTRPGYAGGENLNLNWNGDIFVVATGSTSDLLYTYGTQGTINGNLVLLGNANSEASLELTDSSTRPSDLTINGGLLTLAESTAHESEIELEGTSDLTVNGFVGMFGSRIELESTGSTSSLTVNGSISTGLAQDFDPTVTRTDDFSFVASGEVNLTFDETQVNSAVGGLTELQQEWGVEPSSNAVSAYTFRVRGVLRDRANAQQVNDEMDQQFQTYGSGYDYGVNSAALKEQPASP